MQGFNESICEFTDLIRNIKIKGNNNKKKARKTAEIIIEALNLWRIFEIDGKVFNEKFNVSFKANNFEDFAVFKTDFGENNSKSFHLRIICQEKTKMFIIDQLTILKNSSKMKKIIRFKSDIEPNRSEFALEALNFILKLVDNRKIAGRKCSKMNYSGFVQEAILWPWSPVHQEDIRQNVGASLEDIKMISEQRKSKKKRRKSSILNPNIVIQHAVEAL